MATWEIFFQDMAGGPPNQWRLVEADNEDEALDLAYEEIDRQCKRGELQSGPFPVRIEGDQVVRIEG